MTYGQQLRQEGQVEGSQQNPEVLVRKMLIEGYHLEKIEEITELPYDIVLKLAKEVECKLEYFLSEMKKRGVQLEA